MLVKEDLHSTKNELLNKYSSHVIHQSYVGRDCLKANAFMEFYKYVFMISLCEMLLIPARVFSKQFSKKSDALDSQVFHMMTFKTSMIWLQLIQNKL